MCNLATFAWWKFTYTILVKNFFTCLDWPCSWFSVIGKAKVRDISHSCQLFPCQIATYPLFVSRWRFSSPAEGKIKFRGVKLILTVHITASKRVGWGGWGWREEEMKCKNMNTEKFYIIGWNYFAINPEQALFNWSVRSKYQMHRELLLKNNEIFMKDKAD